MLAVVTFLPLALLAADLSGLWNMTADAPDGKTYKFTLNVKGGDAPAAVISNPQYPALPVRRLVVTADQITFDISTQEAEYVGFKLKFEDGKLKGTLEVPDGDQGPVAGVRATSPEIAGAWKLLATTAVGRELGFTLNLEHKGTALAGTISPQDGGGAPPLSDVALNGTELAFKIPTGGGDYLIKATVNGDQMAGTFQSPDGTAGSFKASRAK